MAKKILNISLWLVFVAGVLFLMSFVAEEQKAIQVDVEKAKIEIEKPGGHVLITRDEILSEMARIGYDSTTSISELDLNEIERIVADHPAIEKVEAYRTLDGRLTIKAKQREPILRIIHKNGVSSYVDNNGDVFPMITGHPANLLIASGEIFESTFGGNVGGIIGHSDAEKTGELFRMACFISNSELWKNQIQQIYVNAEGEYEIIPRVGDHRIIFGSLDDMEKKFKKLEVFYEEGLNYTDWNAFDTLNLKYKDQIVCTKK